jgi:hypothetical protein
MESRLYNTTLLALYQLTVLLGIALLPVALAARRVGIELPIHKMIARLGDAYDETTANTTA